MVLFSIPGIILNIGADIAAMGAVGNMLVPQIHSIFFSIFFTALLLFLIIYLPYEKISRILKFLCLGMLVYFIVPFLYKQDIMAIIEATCIPHITFTKDFLGIIVGILGTTISPYLFFWQASVEVEEQKNQRQLVVNKRIIKDAELDVDFGLGFSGLVMYFIILTTGTVLFKGGIHQIDTVYQAAMALKPLAGDLAYLLFATGVIGTGLIAIPVLSGSLSYIFAEAFGWEQGLSKKFHEAKGFYLIMGISLLLGLGLNYTGISPIQALIVTAVFYGCTSPILIGIILHISNNKTIMGKNTNGILTNVLGFIALVLMAVAAGVLLYLEIVR
jgi:Mn2+/Fe2+ NRAMP family transporter